MRRVTLSVDLALAFGQLLPPIIFSLLSLGCNAPKVSSPFEVEVRELRQLFDKVDDDELKARIQKCIGMLENGQVNETPFLVNASIVNKRGTEDIYLAFSYASERYAGGTLVVRWGDKLIVENIAPVTVLRESDLAYRTQLISAEEWKKFAPCDLDKIEGAELFIRTGSSESNRISIKRTPIEKGK